MNKRSVGILSLAIVVMVLLAYLGAGPTVMDSNRTGQRVLPDLKASLDEVSAVHVQAATRNGAEQATHLVRTNGVWQVQERDGYEVDRAKLVSLLRASAEMQYLEPKTANPELLPQLGLQAISVPDSEALLMTFIAADKSWSVLVGKQPVEREGQYIRLVDDPQAWLADKPLVFAANPAAWLAPVILNIDAAAVTAVVLGAQQPGSVEIDNAADPAQPIENARIVNLPAGKMLKYPGVADEITRSLVNLRLQDVQPYNALEWEGAITVQFELGDNRTLLIRGIEKQGGYWLAVTTGSIFSDADRLVFGLRDDIDHWAYKVGQYHYAQLARTMDDFVEASVEQSNNNDELQR